MTDLYISFLITGYFESRLNEYDEQIKEISDNNNDDNENKNTDDEDKKNRYSSTKKVKYSLLWYCLIVFVCLISPLMIMFVSTY